MADPQAHELSDDEYDEAEEGEDEDLDELGMDMDENYGNSGLSNPDLTSSEDFPRGNGSSGSDAANPDSSGKAKAAAPPRPPAAHTPDLFIKPPDIKIPKEAWFDPSGQQTAQQWYEDTFQVQVTGYLNYPECMLARCMPQALKQSCRSMLRTIIQNSGSDYVSFFARKDLTCQDVVALFAAIPGVKPDTQAVKFKRALSFQAKGKSGNFLRQVIEALSKLDADCRFTPRQTCLIIQSLLPDWLATEVALMPDGVSEWTDSEKLVNYIAKKHPFLDGASCDQPSTSGVKRSASKASLTGNRFAALRTSTSGSEPGPSNPAQRFDTLTNEHSGKRSPYQVGGKSFNFHQKLSKEDAALHRASNACFDCHQQGHRAGDPACQYPHPKHSAPGYKAYAQSKAKPAKR